MRKSEIFYLILDKVSEEAEVREESIMNGSRIQACVEARSVVVKFCRRYGLSNEDVSLIVLRYLLNDQYACPPYADVKKKARVVADLFHKFSDFYEQSFSFRNMYSAVNEWAERTFAEIKTN